MEPFIHDSTCHTKQVTLRHFMPLMVFSSYPLRHYVYRNLSLLEGHFQMALEFLLL